MPSTETSIDRSIMSRASRAMQRAWSRHGSGNPLTAMYLSPTVSTCHSPKGKNKTSAPMKKVNRQPILYIYFLGGIVLFVCVYSHIILCPCKWKHWDDVRFLFVDQERDNGVTIIRVHQPKTRLPLFLPIRHGPSARQKINIRDIVPAGTLLHSHKWKTIFCARVKWIKNFYLYASLCRCHILVSNRKPWRKT